MDGACSENGGLTARGGWSVVYKRCSRFPEAGRVSFALEEKGPTGKIHQHTSNRAELRAVIAALRYRSWKGEGFKSLVIATDSEYVANGATQWVKSWRRNGWKMRNGAAVKNQDLWKFMLGEIEMYEEKGLRVQFWRIPRQWNDETDLYAKRDVKKPPHRNYEDIHGVLT
ncbi:ribonuclease H-like protein [Penicillium cataractarum]|uniref:ribonuclease H n=1 Tax=Penicillium cataractarum TaxID=2100454 RepID=A0A9W9UWS4_9EURO|nr:ribonuclease H-like protein [Penicillium cataractarum]KAJ5359544.1 ribonuclease H-like protein [Penicillium cataractarum]